MSGEQQLERSVLEAKERDELHAIAEALSLKPGSRTKKADLINQILRATGAEVADTVNGTASNGEDKPRRTRTSRAKAAADDTADDTNASSADTPEPEAVAAADQSA